MLNIFHISCCHQNFLFLLLLIYKVASKWMEKLSLRSSSTQAKIMGTVVSILMQWQWFSMKALQSYKSHLNKLITIELGRRWPSTCCWVPSTYSENFTDSLYENIAIRGNCCVRMQLVCYSCIWTSTFNTRHELKWLETKGWYSINRHCILGMKLMDYHHKVGYW